MPAQYASDVTGPVLEEATVRQFRSGLRGQSSVDPAITAHGGGPLGVQWDDSTGGLP